MGQVVDSGATGVGVDSTERTQRGIIASRRYDVIYSVQTL